MKHTLLATTATTALVAFNSAAAAEVTISGTARIGLMTTEGAAAVVVDSTFNMTSADITFVELIDGTSAYFVDVALGNTTNGAIDATISGDVNPTADNITQVKAVREAIATASTDASTAATRSIAVIDLASIDAIIARVNATTTAAVAKKSDQTVGKNRVRVNFGMTGETDSGLAFGANISAHNAAAGSGGTAGTQYISGSFGKVTMGDIDGADEQTVGNLAGVGFAGAGSKQNFGYQSTDHNLGYSISMAGVTFATSTDLVRGADSTKTGSNSAVGIKWSGDMGGATVGIGLGQSKIGTKSEQSASASVAMGGLTIKAVSHTNDNGPLTAAVTAVVGTQGVAHVGSVAAVNNYDTDTTGLSLTYAMDAMTVTAFTRTESTTGVTDKDYSGLGFTYDLGGATLKAGFVDSDNISIVDFGVNFSF
jgi:outer membrane protein OmpU